jgi:hypothetical protein
MCTINFLWDLINIPWEFEKSYGKQCFPMYTFKFLDTINFPWDLINIHWNLKNHRRNNVFHHIFEKTLKIELSPIHQAYTLKCAISMVCKYVATINES